MERNEYLTQLKKHVGMYAEWGWSVIPIALHDKQPDRSVLPVITKKDGKRGASWEPFQQRTPIEWELKKWFGHPRNVGIVTGQVSGIVVVDCDNEAAKNWLVERGLIPAHTPTVKTGKGWHFYFAYPGGQVGNRAGMHSIAGLDLRGQGGQVVAPPSLHSEGHQYRWLTLPHGDLPSLPAWFFEVEKKAAGTSGELSHSASGSHSSQPKSNLTYWERLMNDRLDQLRSTHTNRNHALNRTAYILGQVVGLKHANRAQIEGELWNIARAIGLEENEIGKTIASGVGKGIQDSWKLEAYRREQQRQWIARQEGKR